MPLLQGGGIAAETQEIAAELLREASAIARQVGAKYVELRHEQDLGLGLPVRTDKVKALLPIQQDTEEMWRGLDSRVVRRWPVVFSLASTKSLNLPGRPRAASTCPSSPTCTCIGASCASPLKGVIARWTLDVPRLVRGHTDIRCNGDRSRSLCAGATGCRKANNFHPLTGTIPNFS